MSSDFLVPSQSEVLALVMTLFGGDTKVRHANVDISRDGLCAVYLSDDDSPVAAVVCDTAFGAFAGSALSMIPAGGAEAAARRGELSDAMVDNLYEVMGTCSNLFMDDSTPHLRLGPVHQNVNDVSGDVQALLGRADGPSFQVDIPRYGSGVLRLRS